MMQSQSRDAKVAEWVPLMSIKTREQPRHYFDAKKLGQLVQSIAQHGILEPLLVRPLKPDQYELVAGERRYRAALQLELPEVPVVIRHLNEEEAIQLALIENLQREDLNPIEETEGILRLLSFKLKLPVQEVPNLLYQMKNRLEKEADDKGIEHKNNVIPKDKIPNDKKERAEQESVIQSVFQDLGFMNWLSFTCNRLPLLNLPEEVLDAIRSGQIAYTKALAIARLKDKTQRQVLLAQAIAENLSLNQIRLYIKGFKKLELQSPELRVTALHRRLLKSKLWEDPQRWMQAQTLLAQLEALLDPELPPALDE